MNVLDRKKYGQPVLHTGITEAVNLGGKIDCELYNPNKWNGF
jgi:hypothetical protein